MHATGRKLNLIFWSAVPAILMVLLLLCTGLIPSALAAVRLAVVLWAAGAVTNVVASPLTLRFWLWYIPMSVVSLSVAAVALIVSLYLSLPVPFAFSAASLFVLGVIALTKSIDISSCQKDGRLFAGKKDAFLSCVLFTLYVLPVFLVGLTSMGAERPRYFHQVDSPYYLGQTFEMLYADQYPPSVRTFSGVRNPYHYGTQATVACLSVWTGIQPHIVGFVFFVPLLRAAGFLMGLLVVAEIRRDARIWLSAGLALLFFTDVINNKTAIINAFRTFFTNVNVPQLIDQLSIGGDIYGAGYPMWSTQWGVMALMFSVFCTIRLQRGDEFSGVYLLVIAFAPLFKIPWAVFIGLGYAANVALRTVQSRSLATVLPLVVSGSVAIACLPLSYPCSPITYCSVVGSDGVEHPVFNFERKDEPYTIGQAFSFLFTPQQKVTFAVVATNMPWLIATAVLTVLLTFRARSQDPATWGLALFSLPMNFIAPVLLMIFRDRQNIVQFLHGGPLILGLACYSAVACVWGQLRTGMRRTASIALIALCLPGIIHWSGQLRNSCMKQERFGYVVIEQERISRLLQRSGIRESSIILTNFSGPFHTSHLSKDIPSGIQDHVAAAGFIDFCGNTSYNRPRFSVEMQRREAIRDTLRHRVIDDEFCKEIRGEGVTHLLLDVSLLKTTPTSLTVVAEDLELQVFSLKHD